MIKHLKFITITLSFLITGMVFSDPLGTAIDDMYVSLFPMMEGMMYLVAGMAFVIGLYRFAVDLQEGEFGRGLAMIFMSIMFLVLGSSFESLMTAEIVEQIKIPEEKDTGFDWFFWGSSLAAAVGVSFIAKFIVKSLNENNEFIEEADSDNTITREQQSFDIIKAIEKRLPSISSKWKDSVVELRDLADDLIKHSVKADDATKGYNLVAVRMLDKLTNTLTINNGELSVSDEKMIDETIKKIRDTMVYSSNKISNRRLKKMRIDLEVIGKNLGTNQTL